MKKLLCTILALATAMSLCACGNKEDDDDTPKKDKKPNKQTESMENSKPANPFEDLEPTEATLPEEPTKEEEKEAIRNYYYSVQDFRTTAKSTLDKNEYSSEWEYLQEQYNKLLEYGDMTKWANTVYATDLCGDVPSELFNPETDWNPQAVLADFTVIKDTLLRYENITEDNLGNIVNTWDMTTWFYDAKGNAICINGINNYAPLAPIADESAQNGYREYDDAGRLIKITESYNGTIDSITTFTYDADGKLIKQEYKNNTTSWSIDNYTYDAEGRLISASWVPKPSTLSDEIYEVVYTYNADGTLAKEEKKIYQPTNAGERVIDEHFCKEYTYADGKLTSAKYTKKYYNITTAWGEGVVGSWLNNEYTETSTYSHDDKGRVVQEVTVPGDDIYYTYEGKVLQTRKPTVAKYTYNSVYGDYVVYTPAK